MNTYDNINKKDLILEVSIVFMHHTSYYGYTDSPFFIYKAFELCAMGDFNLSHTSLMSAKALAALCELHKTNPALHAEITTGIAKDTANDEPVFSVEVEASAGDGSDILIEVVRAVVMSQGSAAINGFAIDEQGSVMRTGVAETESTMEVITAELAVKLGHGR
jgi:hypothetical protein